MLHQISDTVDAAISDRPPSLAIGKPANVDAPDNLYARFEAACHRSPDETSVIDELGVLTFAELNACVETVARGLQKRGLRPGDICGVWMKTSRDFLVAWLACLRLGVVALQIPTTHRGGAVLDLVEDVKIALVIGEQAHAGHLVRPSGRGAICLFDGLECREVGDATVPDGAEQRGKLTVKETPRADDIAFAALTSGSTGAPKVIPVTHRAALMAVDWREAAWPACSDEREACNVFFIWEMLRPLMGGRAVHITPDDVIRDCAQLSDYLRRHDITRVLLTPSLAQAFARHELARAAQVSNQPLSLRTLILNGECASRGLADELRASLPGVDLCHDYSICEAHDVATSVPLNDDAKGRATPRRYCGPTLPCGGALPGVRIYILNAERELQPWGVPGSIYIAGDTIGPGYLNAPDETEVRFLPDPFQSSDQRMFHTGDRGRLMPDGQLQVFGRCAFMVKIRGHSVVPAAVEAALMRSAQIASCAVVPVMNADDDVLADHLEAVVVLERGVDATDGVERRLLDDVRTQLPPEAVPSRIVFVEAIPVAGASGKRDQKALADIIAAEGNRQAESFTVGRSDDPDKRIASAGVSDDVGGARRAHEAVVGAWRAVLGRAPTDASDNFFEHGGHSLKAVQFAEALHARAGVSVTAADVYAAPTVGGLAEALAVMHASRPQQPSDGASSSHNNRYGVEVMKRGDALRDGASRDAAASRDGRIAIVSAACRFPGVSSAQALWDAVRRQNVTYAADQRG
ncbi:MAG: AMP-binding protein, partial [Pseudomonadota bacterium]